MFTVGERSFCWLFSNFWDILPKHKEGKESNEKAERVSFKFSHHHNQLVTLNNKGLAERTLSLLDWLTCARVFLHRRNVLFHHSKCTYNRNKKEYMGWHTHTHTHTLAAICWQDLMILCGTEPAGHYWRTNLLGALVSWSTLTEEPISRRSRLHWSTFDDTLHANHRRRAPSCQKHTFIHTHAFYSTTEPIASPGTRIKPLCEPSSSALIFVLYETYWRCVN